MSGRRAITVAGVLKDSVHEFLADNCTHLAAAISYYFLLSLFPLALAAISIFGFVLRSESVEETVTTAITDFLPVSADYVSRVIEGVSSNWGAAGIIATIGLIWAGTAVFNVVRKSVNTAWGIREPRPFLHERMLEFVMMLGLGLLMALSIGVTTAFKIIREADTAISGLLADGGLLWHAATTAASIALIFLAFLFLYKVVPNTTVKWRHALIGALVAAVLFEIVKQIFIWFVGNFATYNLVYGTVGVVIALMSWTYVSALILLFCAKMTSIYPRMRESLEAQAAAEANGELEPLALREEIKEKVKAKVKVPSPPSQKLNGSWFSNGSFGFLRRMIPGRR